MQPVGKKANVCEKQKIALRNHRRGDTHLDTDENQNEIREQIQQKIMSEILKVLFSNSACDISNKEQLRFFVNDDMKFPLCYSGVIICKAIDTNVEQLGLDRKMRDKEHDGAVNMTEKTNVMRTNNPKA